MSTQPSKTFWSVFFSNKVTLGSVVLLLFFGGIALFAPLITTTLGVDESSQRMDFRNLGAFSTSEGRDSQLELKLEQKIQQNPEWAATVANVLRQQDLTTAQSNEDALFEVFDKTKNDNSLAEKLAQKSQDPAAREFLGTLVLQRSHHLLGTDDLGRDVFARLSFGARVSLSVALFTGLSAAFIGLVIGLISGFFGGWLDTLLMRFTDLMLALPVTPLLIVMAAIDFRALPVLGNLVQLTTPELESVLKVCVILCLFAWMPMARLVRGSVLSVKQSEFVNAAKCAGASNFRIVARHVLPNVLAPLIVAVTLATGENMLFESALSFLGLGIQPPTPSWGNMLQNAMDLISSAPFQALVPGVCIFAVGVCVNFCGDGLRDAMDPRT
jgi:peptide/nickel transport system permease protein